MKPLHLNEDELAAVMTAAAPLEVPQRGPFLAAVATALRAQGESRSGPVSSIGRSPACNGNSGIRRT